MSDIAIPEKQPANSTWPVMAPVDFDYYNLVSLLNNTQDLMWSISTEQKMLAFNKAFADMVKGISGYEVVKGGDAPLAGFDEERLERWREYYIRTFSGETFSTEEYTEQPVEYWAEVSFYPILQNGKVIGATCYSRNITERKLFERALEQRNAELLAIKSRLEESQRNLSEAQEMAKVGSWSVDLATSRTYWSDELYKIFGVEKGKVTPSFESYLSTIHNDDLDTVGKLVAEGFRQLRGYSFHCRVVQPDGTERYVYSDCRFTLDATGQPAAINGIVHDITERTSSEARLRHSEARLKQAQAVAHVGSWEVNFEKSYSIWSDESYRIYGLEPGDHNITFEKWLEFIHPEDIDGFREEMKRCEKTYADSSFYHRIVRPDKSIRFVISECRYELNNGRPVGLYGTVQDITEKVAMEEKLVQSHRLLEKLTDYIPAAVYQFEMDSEGRMTFPFMSKGFHSLFPGVNIEGIKSDASLLFNFVHQDDVRELSSSIEASRQQLTNWILEFRAITDGSERWFHGESKPEKKQNGTTVWYGYLQDVTERRLAQEKIRVAKERYDMVAKATNDAIYDWDIQKGTVVSVGGLKDLFGDDQHTFTADAWKGRIHPDDLPELLESVELRLADPLVHNFEYEYRARKNDGDYAYIYEKSFIMRDGQGKATRMIGARQDISHRKHTEVLLQELNERLERRAGELAKSNTELEQFAYIASHDLQEPLRMVTSFLTQLELKYGTQLDERAKRYIHFATDGAVRMRRIILDLLEYSRVGRRPDEKDTVDTAEVLLEAVQLNRATIDEKKALIQWKNLPAVKANKMALQQVFQNLIANALKYQESGRQPVIEVSARETETHWQFSFKDNGIGIEPRFFDKIFAVFQRLHNREEFSGTGIGLAICKKIVESHHGQIWVESEPGAGSTFHCTFEKN